MFRLLIHNTLLLVIALCTMTLSAMECLSPNTLELCGALPTSNQIIYIYNRNVRYDFEGNFSVPLLWKQTAMFKSDDRLQYIVPAELFIKAIRVGLEKKKSILDKNSLYKEFYTFLIDYLVSNKKVNAKDTAQLLEYVAILSDNKDRASQSMDIDFIKYSNLVFKCIELILNRYFDFACYKTDKERVVEIIKDKDQNYSLSYKFAALKVFCRNHRTIIRLIPTHLEQNPEIYAQLIH